MVDAVDFWRSHDGDAYHHRNSATNVQLQSRIDLWSDILRHIKRPNSILEVGAGEGQNLKALGALCPYSELAAIEPNEAARAFMVHSMIVAEGNARDGLATALPYSDFDFDLVFTSGVLIHIPPENLLLACSEIYRVSARYIIIIEYFSAEPEMKLYRGEADKLWKRDFGQFWVDNFPLTTVACGFAWKHLTGLDNLTWWIFEK